MRLDEYPTEGASREVKELVEAAKVAMVSSALNRGERTPLSQVPLCMYCKHSEQLGGWICHRFDALWIGVACHQARNEEDKCGYEGRYFEHR